ncbi:MAG: dehydrogenase, partial [Verrucomicrobiota bacterium]
MCVLGDRVIVSRSPDILVFEDRNGDLRADGPPRRLFTGIGWVDHDHGAHAFLFGPDGKLYFNVGNDGRQLKKADGSGWVVDVAGHEVREHRQPYQQGLVLRCNPDGSAVETLAWNFRNNYEVTVDSFGTLW